ncbi:MAG: ABC transporter permease subunit [Candidatus Poribacteria bacterium]|nr:ABC transporter permease subunit [Candidatus Poribacteria bacterium]
MKRSVLIYQSIALITLAVAFILFWSFSKGTPFVESGLTFDETAADSYSVLQENLYRMVPILLGSIFFSIAIAFYLEEWLAETSWIYGIIAQQITILASIPSLLYGLLGLYFFVLQSEKGSFFTHALTFVLLVMPITIQSTQKAIRGVDISVREAAFALGANRWRVVVDHVFPNAFPTIVAGICTAISRVLAITALIIIVYIWKEHTLQSGDTFNIPSSVIVLLSFALLSSVISSFLEKKTNLT